jgi:hypothetical protein
MLILLPMPKYLNKCFRALSDIQRNFKLFLLMHNHRFKNVVDVRFKAFEA